MDGKVGVHGAFEEILDQSDQRIEISQGHTYTVDGRVYPSVTQVIGEVLSTEKCFYTPESRDRGIDVHRITAEIDSGKSIDDSMYRGYVSAYRKFLDECKPRWTFVEQKFFEPVWKYCGTVDRVGYILGKNVIVDIKTGSVPYWAGIQLAAYERGFPVGKLQHRYALQLFETGRYKLHPFTDPNDIRIFHSALTIYYWKKSKH